MSKRIFSLFGAVYHETYVASWLQTRVTPSRSLSERRVPLRRHRLDSGCPSLRFSQDEYWFLSRNPCFPHALSGALIRISLALVSCSTPALAQRAGENAVTSAEDAFGTTVGRESIGIYDNGNVRGFSPSSAGNIRIEGLYFDSQGGLTTRVNDGETIHVGPSTQDYAFPAPTGIVDLTLRSSGKTTLVSPLISATSFGSRGAEVDAQLPIAAAISSSIGAGSFINHYANGGKSRRWNLGIVPRWRPANNGEVIAFYSREQSYADTAEPTYIPTGHFLPDRIERGRYPGPGFLLNDYYNQAFGALGHAKLDDWTIRAGVFRSSSAARDLFSNVIEVAPGNSTTRTAYAYPPSGSSSWSGEFRLSRRFSDGLRQHLLTAAFRGRNVVSRYGGGDKAELGNAGLNEDIDTLKPAFVFGSLTDDRTHQITGALSYSLKWRAIGELTVGLQRTRYVKRVSAPSITVARRSDDAWLPTASAAVPMTKRLSVYASFVYGLEDSGTAPGYAVNGNQVLPALRTHQYDFGAQWSMLPGTTLIIGYYDIEKLYIDLNSHNFYGVLGQEAHRGIEVSLKTSPARGLDVVVGGAISTPRVVASSEVAEPVGSRPVGIPDTHVQLNVNYTLPFAKAFTIDAYLDHDSSVAANVGNSLFIPGFTRFGAGVRYHFKLSEKSATLRFSAFNLGDVYRLIPVGSGAYIYNYQRSFSVYLTADF